MKSKFRALVLVLLLLAAAVCFTACENKEDVTNLTFNPEASDLAYLEEYPNLQSVDLRGYHNYDEIWEYVQSHPQVAVAYDVIIGSQTVSHDAAEIQMEPKLDSIDVLMDTLKYLPSVTKIKLPDTRLNLELMAELQAAYPGIELEYTVSLLDKIYEANTTTLDLSAMTSEQLAEIINSLSLLPDLTEVELMTKDGSSGLTLADVAQLQDAKPETFFHYSFDLFGQIVSTADEIVEYDEVAIGNEGEAQIREALNVLDKCTYFKLDDCGLDNEVMASIREDYPDKKIVWRVHIEPFSMLTDETMLRLTFHLTNDNMHDLKYLNDVTYIDVGHNSPLTDLSFIQYMPKLECVIISGSNVVDVSVFKHCPNLVWLEMCFCYNIEDISFLKDHKTLKYLNISFSDVSDISCLENVALERLNCMGTNVNWEQRQAFIEKHPDCLSIWEGKQPYGYGWRYNDYGYTFFEYYANMRIVFRYDEKGYFGNHKEKN